VNRDTIAPGIPVIDFLSVNTAVFPSKGEARRMLQSNGVSINKNKIGEQYTITTEDILKEKFILVQKGKKEYHLVSLV
jgi:tyrosyl-tRNA synthetase